LLIISACKKDEDDPSVIKDGDGNIYTTVTIGTQMWLKENLKSTSYNDGTAITEKTGNSDWSNSSTGAYCWYDNDAANKTTFGALYNWYTVNTGRLCPKGWHVPDDSEWTIMENYLIANGFNYDGTTIDNLIAKALATASGWDESSFPGDVGNTDYPAKRNATGFSALPGGNRISLGTYEYIGGAAVWWTATEYVPLVAWSRYIISASRSMT